MPSTEPLAWSLRLDVTPTSSGESVIYVVEVTLPGEDTSWRTHAQVAGPDLLHVRLEGELTNALRHVTNDIMNKVIKPNQQKRRQSQL